MDFIETILAKVMAEDLTKVSEKEILMALLFEVKTLNKKVDGLEIKIEETAKLSATTTQILEIKYDEKFREIELRLKLHDETNLEGKFWKKLLSYIPPLLGAILVVFGIVEFILKFLHK